MGGYIKIMKLQVLTRIVSCFTYWELAGNEGFIIACALWQYYEDEDGQDDCHHVQKLSRFEL